MTSNSVLYKLLISQIIGEYLRVRLFIKTYTPTWEQNSDTQ